MKLAQRLRDFATKISGATVVDNMQNPMSAAYMRRFPPKIAYRSPANPNGPANLPNQNVYGAPQK